MILDDYLKQHGVWHRFIPKRETVHTADASNVTGIELHRITKNLICLTDAGEHVVLVVAGDKKVNLRRAAEALGVGNVKLMPFSEAKNVSGYPPGATPSLGYRTPVRVVVDSELTELETIYCGGGTRVRLLEVRVEDVIRLNKAIIAPISRVD